MTSLDETRPIYSINPYRYLLRLSCTNSRINANTSSKTLRSTSFLYVLIELLIEKGLLTTEELDERKRQVTERLAKRNLRD